MLQICLKKNKKKPSYCFRIRSTFLHTSFTWAFLWYKKPEAHRCTSPYASRDHCTSQPFNVHLRQSKGFNTHFNWIKMFVHGLFLLIRLHVEPQSWLSSWFTEIYNHKSQWMLQWTVAVCCLCNKNKALLWNKIIESMLRYIIPEPLSLIHYPALCTNRVERTEDQRTQRDEMIFVMVCTAATDQRVCVHMCVDCRICHVNFYPGKP